MMQAILATTSAIALASFSNGKLAALNNALTLEGVVPAVNVAFQTAVEAALIRPDGRPFDLEILLSACAYEVNRRVEASTFN